MALGLRSKKNKTINKVVLLPVSEIDRSPNQPRKLFDEDDLQDLSRSIAANGLLQPITVRKMQNGRYQLVSGERRTMAFQSLGRDTIPAIIEEYTDEQSAVLTLIENLQRKDLNFFEEAAGIARVMKELGLNQQQVSARLGKAQSTVANKLRLLKFHPRVQAMLLQAGLTERHARALLKLDDQALQEETILYLVEKELNVEQTDAYVESLLSREEGGRHSTRLFVVKDVRLFLNSIQKAVDMMDRAGIQVDTVKKEDEEFLEYTIRIPKSHAFQAPKEKPAAEAAI